MKNSSWIIWIGIICAIIAIVLLLKYCKSSPSTEEEQISLVNSLQDSLEYYKGKDSFNVATIDVLQTQSTNNFTNLQLRDKEVQSLQATVKEYQKKLKAGSSVTKALIETAIAHKGVTTVKHDTIFESTEPVLLTPVYYDTLKNQWLDYTARMDMDTSTFSLKVYNSFTAIVGYDKKRPFVDLITENPYSSVKQLRTYQVSLPKPKRFGIGPSIGGTYIANRIRPFVGVSLNYNLIEF